ncbi:Na+/H+ antiporter subunit G [Hydrogenophilus thermoluteolus]|uniref:Monovalent cation/H+ antiporter subunit G n=1 Tax=Hydrogenophilus thermoluteolus TaxID=297 RepID=A0A2Z6DZN1_HYDTE|nr:Na+/H+ antiporter subunit G [Hydrogenophilus thermoluteolus]BBD78016.1 monovalent cation/H+ antiporter subunit G [Hydrogenophilus thermoluteolus]
MVSQAWEWLIAGCVLAGTFFTFVGAIGLNRFRDTFQRLHAPTKASTLGIGMLLIASMIAAWQEGRPGFAELLITLFVFLTAPVSASLLAQAAIRRRCKGGPPASAAPETPQQTEREGL